MKTAKTKPLTQQQLKRCLAILRIKKAIVTEVNARGLGDGSRIERIIERELSKWTLFYNCGAKARR